MVIVAPSPTLKYSPFPLKLLVLTTWYLSTYERVNEQQHTWKIIKSPIYKYCGNPENLEHFFYFLTLGKNISRVINLTGLGVLFRLLNMDPKFYSSANYAILTPCNTSGKHLISKVKKQSEYFDLEHFLKYLKWNLKAKRLMCQNQCRSLVYQERFNILD